MTDLTLKFAFTDRGGAAVYDVFQLITSGLPDGLHVGQVRIPPDPRIAELEAERDAASQHAKILNDENRELYLLIERVKALPKYNFSPTHHLLIESDHGYWIKVSDRDKALTGVDKEKGDS